MWQFETTVLEVIPRTPDIKTFRLDARGRDDVKYEAGQFFYVTISVDGREADHIFSISSSPTETAEKKYLEFTKRITGSDYSRALATMKPGAWARIRGAGGDFTLPDDGQHLCFLSGGIGITPFRSMLRYIVDKWLHYDIVLLYGNSTWDNIPFREELEEIANLNRGLRVEHVLSGPDVPPWWQGKTGRITKDIIVELVPDYRERTFYASGPLPMVRALEEQLMELDIPKSQVRHDYFPGYDD